MRMQYIVTSENQILRIRVNAGEMLGILSGGDGRSQCSRGIIPSKLYHQTKPTLKELPG